MPSSNNPEQISELRLSTGARVRTRAANDGKGVALALGGGFSRGFAHLGVLEVLEQERIPVCAIAGTSIGGLLGAAYADGTSIQRLCEIGRGIRVRDFVRFLRQDTDASANNLIGGFIRGSFAAKRVEELLIPTAMVATDLSTCAPYVFTSGSLDVAMRATCAFPGLFAPVRHEGLLLADGCISSPVPTAVAARMRALCVLGISVGSYQESAPEATNVVQIFGRARGSARSIKLPLWTQDADIVLEPEVHAIEWSDFSQVDRARAAGAAVMRQALPSLRALLARRAYFQDAPERFEHPETRLAV